MNYRFTKEIRSSLLAASSKTVSFLLILPFTLYLNPFSPDKCYIEGCEKMSKPKVEKVEKVKEEHVKKHDHSVLGKHNKKEKKAYLEAQAQPVATPEEK